MDGIHLSKIMNFSISFLFLLIILIEQSLTQMPPVVPLTNALTAVYCHNSDEPGIMTIRCGSNEKIRMLDAFDATVRHKSHLPIQCLNQKQFLLETNENSNDVDCKIHTSFTSACSGRENCTLHMQRIRLNSVHDNCHNELVDYTMAFFECISDVFIHNVCSSQEITSAWGTLQTPNFPNPYTSNDDCWCKLSTQLKHRLLLSVIVFQLIPYDKHCAGAGLYLQSSDQQRSTQCTYLQQGHNYLSDTNSLYINFYSRTPTVRGGFWIVYEASHPNAEVHLRCGLREKIGVPPSSNSVSPSSVSTPFDHGWSRLAFNNPPNPTTVINNHMRHMRLTLTTSQPTINTNYKLNTSTSVGAFTYPHGALTTFELAYGPRGWYLKYPFDSSNKTLTKLLRTTAPSSELLITKENSTRSTTQSKLMSSFTTIRTSTTARKSTKTSTTTIKQTTTVSSSTPISMSTTQTTASSQRSSLTHKPWRYYSSRNSQSFLTSTMVKSTIKSTNHSSAVPSTIKTTLPLPTPWYSPAGPFDWWQWRWYTKKFKNPSLKIHSTVQPSTINTQTMATVRKTSFSPSSSSTTTTTTTTTTTVTTTTTTTTIAVSPTTTTRIIATTKSTSSLSTKLNRITTNRKQETMTNWFKWLYTEPNVNTKQRLNDFQEHYKNWLNYFTDNNIKGVLTSTVTTNALVSTSSRQQYSPNKYRMTKSKWKPIIVNTPPAKRYHSQENSDVSQRNAVRTQINGQTTTPDVQDMIREVIERRNRKSSMEYGWLNKTDMTIVAVSILFVILLAIINLVLFAVRRHRHRLQGRHLLSTSISSTLDNRRLGGNGHLRSPAYGGTSSGSANTTNNNNDDNNDILPAVGEIVIWDEKDQGGYMIDNNGAWAKIEGRQWFGSNLFKSCTKTPLAKSFRSRFRFMRHLDKKANHHDQAPITPKTHQLQQQAFKFPLLMDTATLSPVPEADDYESSELSLSDAIIRSSATVLQNSNKRQRQPLIKSERKHNLSPQSQQQKKKFVQALVHNEQQQTNEYYKRIGNSDGDDSNYVAMPENAAGDSSVGDQETDRSVGNEVDTGGPVAINVPTMIRGDDEAGTITDGAESIYNPHCSLQSFTECSHPNYLQSSNNNNNNSYTSSFCTKPPITTFKPTTNNSVIVSYCQTDFQPFDPQLLFKSTDKTSLNEYQKFYRCSQSVQSAAYDSGFVDEQAVVSLTATGSINGRENNLINKGKDEHMSMDDILLTKSEDDDDYNGDALLSGQSTDEFRQSNRRKWRNFSKRVSFQEEYVTQRFSPPPPSSFDVTTNLETSSNQFDMYNVSTDGIPTVSHAPSSLRSFLPPSTTLDINDSTPTASTVFTIQKQITSIDNEDNAENVIMNHLHSVKSLKKFFETKMIIQRPIPGTHITNCSQSITATNELKYDRLSSSKEQKPIDELEQRQEMMNQVLESLRKRKNYTKTKNDTLETSGRYSAMTTSSYDSNVTQNLAVQRHYSRRFRSSSTSNNSLCPGGNIITNINPSNSCNNKRAHSHDRQYYQTTDHHPSHTEKWKQEQQQQQQIESDEEDNISENSMLWQARTKLNEFVTRTRKNQQQSPYYTTCVNDAIPSEDFSIYDDNESTAETRF